MRIRSCKISTINSSKQAEDKGLGLSKGVVGDTVLSGWGQADLATKSTEHPSGAAVAVASSNGHPPKGRHTDAPGWNSSGP